MRLNKNCWNINKVEIMVWYRLFYMDLAICSVWLLAILGSRHCGNTLILFLAVFAAVMRISFSFAMVERNKQAWMPLVGVALWGGLMAQSNISIGIYELMVYPFYLLNIGIDSVLSKVIGIFCIVWIWLLPILLYFYGMYRKKLVNGGMKRGELLGGILWKSRWQRTYSALMLICVMALYSGLTMDMRINFIICLVAPILSFWLVFNYFHLVVPKIWLLVIAMFIFFYSQPVSGLCRVLLLAVSFVMVVYMSTPLYKATGKLLLACLTVVYVGVFLPSLSIGYNQYTCIEYGRYKFSSCHPYKGIFYINDASGDKIGLRDRYGLLVKPEYEDILPYDKRGGDVELRKNGHVALYNIPEASLKKCDDIDEELQDDICKALDGFSANYCSDYNDRMEVRVDDMLTGKVLAHVRVSMYGLPHYYYKTEPFLPELKHEGKFCSALISIRGARKRMLDYVRYLPKDSMQLYRIHIKIARNEMPIKSMAINLFDEISKSRVLHRRYRTKKQV